jgi:hypothetical protein
MKRISISLNTGLEAGGLDVSSLRGVLTALEKLLKQLLLSKVFCPHLAEARC